MRMYDLIVKKRNGEALTEKEIKYFISGYTNDEIPDYQVSALAMAIYFQDMNEAERAALTMAIANSGDTLDLGSIDGIKVDKHSTGGVGDTTTLILAPLVASLGIPVAKMSGRGLGHTGGTIDKLESVPGFHVEISKQDFIEQVNAINLAVIGQSGDLTPADKKLYSLRDVTGTVDSIPLIASSIMSKKIASGADAIVLDVKTGSGAFMKKEEESVKLAEAMVSIGQHVGRNTMAVISDMSQPLGWAVGNALEIKEAIDTLSGNGPDDLRELSLTLGSQMVVLGGKTDDLVEARLMLEEAIETGKSLNKFKEFLKAQGGDETVVDEPEKLPQSKYQIKLEASEAGYIHEMAAEEIGHAASLLGAGRQTKDSEIDLSVGVVLHKKVGDTVDKGEPLLTIHSNQTSIDHVKHKLNSSIKIIDEPVIPPELIRQIITK